MRIQQITGRKYRANAYLVVEPEELRALVIDIGDETFDEVDKYISQADITVDYLLLTHEHIDHISDADRLREQTGCELVSSQACSRAIGRPELNLSKYWETGEASISPADVSFDSDWYSFDWCGHQVRFLSTPGHSPGSACIAIGERLFTGDTLIGGLKTVTKLPGGCKESAARSLQKIYRNFPSKSVVHPGHGTQFLLAEMTIDQAMGVR